MFTTHAFQLYNIPWLEASRFISLLQIYNDFVLQEAIVTEMCVVQCILVLF